MNQLKPNAKNGKINEFLQVEPSVAFGSSGPRCKLCDAHVSPKEYITITWSPPEERWPRSFGYLTDTHKCVEHVKGT